MPKQKRAFGHYFRKGLGSAAAFFILGVIIWGVFGDGSVTLFVVWLITCLLLAPGLGRDNQKNEDKAAAAEAQELQEPQAAPENKEE